MCRCADMQMKTAYVILNLFREPTGQVISKWVLKQVQHDIKNIKK